MNLPKPSLMNTLHKVLATVVALLMIATSGNAMATPSDQEARHIEALIQRVATMKGITFIRNGTEAKADGAAKHLRDKYAYFRTEIGSAEDFIRLCGTKSEFSGRAYTVRLPDGTLRPSAELLVGELRKFRMGSP